jgi:RNA dependent RNA polymerase
VLKCRGVSIFHFSVLGLINITFRSLFLTLFQYAVEGKECRKYLLAHETNSFMRDRGPLLASSQLRKYSFCTKPHMCDNCCFEKRESNFKKIDISSVVGDLLFEVLSKKDAFDIGRVEKAATMMKTNALPQARAVLDLLLARCKGEKSKHSLLSDLVKYFERNHEGFIDVIPKGHLEFFIQYAKLEGKKAWYDFDRIPVPSKPATVKPRLSFNCTTQTIWPFLILYESNRLGLRVENMFPNGLIGPLSVACQTVYEKAEQKPASYIVKLGKMEKRTGNIHSPVSVSYRAELQGNGKLKLLEPENAVDRRIYRMYGSERFLEISFPSSISSESILSYILAPFHVCGRLFRFFWLKREDGIRAVLFAEEGSCLDYIPVSHIREQCIPKSSNPELTLGKWVKRMKQNFSDTTVGCTLPPGCVTILDDYNEAGVAEIDGAGLVSDEALSAIWNGYNTNRAEKSENLGNGNNNGNSQNLPCPYSGFQGRLAGLVKSSVVQFK